MLDISRVFAFVLNVSFLLAFLYFLQSRFTLDINILLLSLIAILLSAINANPAFQITGAALIIISEIDRREYRIPDVFTKSALFALSLLLREQISLLIVAWAWICLAYIITTFAPHAFGRGDVKLIGALILLNGYFDVGNEFNFLVILLFIASFLALPAALFRKFRGLPGKFPFAPAITGAWLLLSAGTVA